MSAQSCPQCKKGTLTWNSRSKGEQLVDVLSCDSCGAVQAEEDWVVPLRLPGPGHCCNCGSVRKAGVCVSCGLSAEDDDLVHRELRDLIDTRSTMLAAARAANEAGRRLMALKLATAAFVEDPSIEAPRVLRIEILHALHEDDDALVDARTWVTENGQNSALAWSTYGDVLRNVGRKGEAVEAMRRALELAPHLHAVRARLAELLYGIDRFAMAREEAVTVLRSAPEGEPAEQALAVLGQYIRRLIQQQDFTEVQTLLVEIGEPAKREANLICGLGWMAFFRQEPDEVMLHVRAARRLVPEHDLCLDLERRVAPKKKAWWSWT